VQDHVYQLKWLLTKKFNGLRIFISATWLSLFANVLNIAVW